MIGPLFRCLDKIHILPDSIQIKKYSKIRISASWLHFFIQIVYTLSFLGRKLMIGSTTNFIDAFFLEEVSFGILAHKELKVNNLCNSKFLEKNLVSYISFIGSNHRVVIQIHINCARNSPKIFRKNSRIYSITNLKLLD